jgi:hypothetical protein
LILIILPEEFQKYPWCNNGLKDYKLNGNIILTNKYLVWKIEYPN